MIFDAGRKTTFGTATWTADVPAGPSLRFQVAVSSSAGGPWVFVGPDGTAGSYFTSSGTAFTTPPTGRYVCYRAALASDVGHLASPKLSGFNLSLGGATSRVVSYTYDSAGNMTSKTDGTQTTSYAWDSHNRQVQVTQPDGTTEAYTYDGVGLMLSSRKSTDTAATTYVWRGKDLVQETASDGSVTRCNVVNGVLVSFERGGETYTVQSDATLGHVRSVTGSSWTVVYTSRSDAWGNVLAVTDNVPGRMPARYVGGLGVRWDATTGLHYMRHRWYDPGLQQYMSVDPLRRNPDLYEYANDGLNRFVDPTGLKCNPSKLISLATSLTRSSEVTSQCKDTQSHFTGSVIYSGRNTTASSSSKCLHLHLMDWRSMDFPFVEWREHGDGTEALDAFGTRNSRRTCRSATKCRRPNSYLWIWSKVGENVAEEEILTVAAHEVVYINNGDVPGDTDSDATNVAKGLHCYNAQWGVLNYMVRYKIITSPRSEDRTLLKVHTCNEQSECATSREVMYSHRIIQGLTAKQLFSRRLLNSYGTCKL